jgi:T-complex protein 1 subunit gamma
MVDSMGTLVITNDGNAILHEINVAHPAAKAVVELARGQEEEVGDGTTTVVVLTGKIEPLLQMRIHPHVIVAGLRKALDALVFVQRLAHSIDTSDDTARSSSRNGRN